MMGLRVGVVTRMLRVRHADPGYGRGAIAKSTERAGRRCSRVTLGHTGRTHPTGLGGRTDVVRHFTGLDRWGRRAAEISAVFGLLCHSDVERELSGSPGRRTDKLEGRPPVTTAVATSPLTASDRC